MSAVRQGENSHLYNFNNNSFTLIDSLEFQYVKDFGDFNNNGLIDLLTYFTYDGFIERTNITKFIFF